ncbi:MAG: DUF2125 domain-containing protein [Alphaproteobacteria bacterium]
MRYYILIGVVAAVAAAWTGAWFFIAGQVRGEIQAGANQGTAARELTYRALRIGGFPFRIKVEVSRPRLALRGGRMDFRWEADKISAVRHLWQPRHVVLDLTTQHRFKAAQDGSWRELTLDSRQAMASVETGADGRLQRLSLDIKEVRFGLGAATAGQRVLPEAARGRRLQFHARMSPDEAESIDLALRGDGFEIANGVLPAHMATMAPMIGLFDLQTTVTGWPRNWSASPPGEGASPSPLARWRDGGGTLEIRTFHLLWGKVEITATGSLALDHRMRPIGALTARIKGHNALLDIAVASKTMSKNSAFAARAVLGLLAAAGGGILSVPVRLQDGQLYLGPIAVAKLAPLALN